MGGSAFKDPTIRTPRMPPDIYQEIKARVTSLLKQHFQHVSVPIEAPAKTSYGDLDVLICSPLPGPGQDHISKPENISVLLEARIWKRISGSTTINLALPWPDSPSDVDTGTLGTTSNDDDTAKTFGTSPPHKPTPKPAGRFIQVDITICPTLQNLHWLHFIHAHGDMWNLLGSMLRRFGLVVNDKALYILVPELASANANKNLTRVKITDDPRQVLDYMGLDHDTFWQPFESVEAMMKFAATSCFHNPERGRKKVRGDEDVHDELGVVRTTANDRRRAAQRPIFREWLEVYLPEHVDDDSVGSKAKSTKEEVVEDAKLFFGEAFEEKFDKARMVGVRVVGVQKLWADVRVKLTKDKEVEGSELGYAMKGLKRCIQGEGFEKWVQAVILEAAREYKDDIPSTPPVAEVIVEEHVVGKTGGVSVDGDANGDVDNNTDVNTDSNEPEQTTFEDIGYDIPGLIDARRDFKEGKYDLVFEWVMEDDKWSMVGIKQKEKDERESGEKLRLKIEREEERERLERKLVEERERREERRGRLSVGGNGKGGERSRTRSLNKGGSGRGVGEVREGGKVVDLGGKEG